MIEMTEYVRGKRRIFAFFYLLESILKRNRESAKRELEIMKGYAKPYQVIMKNEFIQSLRILGFSEEEIDKLGDRENKSLIHIKEVK